ncbi:hypothetical protein JTE90_003936 [Oedothorax gibbosus]|uniref:Uncharacterized protein n=1 Tax=Oedothorax gibbosus TaxID=931172 RepID=A0AAV6UWH3_9ARAC|nr:hypothetical protein JTE90_003936 [Oedothorax gibbosus]
MGEANTPLRPKIIFLSTTAPLGYSKISPSRMDVKKCPPFMSRPPVYIQILTGHLLLPLRISGVSKSGHSIRGRICQTLNMSQGSIKGGEKVFLNLDKEQGGILWVRWFWVDIWNPGDIWNSPSVDDMSVE